MLKRNKLEQWYENKVCQYDISECGMVNTIELSQLSKLEELKHNSSIFDYVNSKGENDLINAICDIYNCHEDNILITNGAVEELFIVLLSLIDRCRIITCQVPCYNRLEHFLKKVKYEIKYLELKSNRDAFGGVVYADEEYQVEFVSPILGYEDLELLLQIVGALQRAGAEPSDMTGIHIHVSEECHTVKSLRNLLNLFMQKEILMREAFQIDKCRLDGYCRWVQAALIPQIRYKALKKDFSCEVLYSCSLYGWNSSRSSILQSRTVQSLQMTYASSRATSFLQYRSICFQFISAL